MTTKTTQQNKKPILYKNSLGKGFLKKGDTLDLRGIRTPLTEGKSGKDLGKEIIRSQIGTWFADKRAKKEMGDVMPISQDDVDSAIDAFLKKGGVIKKLEPGIARMVEDDFSEEPLEDSEIDKLEKILTLKINEMRY